MHLAHSTVPQYKKFYEYSSLRQAFGKYRKRQNVRIHLISNDKENVGHIIHNNSRRTIICIVKKFSRLPLFLYVFVAMALKIENQQKTVET